MGNVLIKIKKCVKWVGNVFNKFISWFKKYMLEVNKNTESFLNENLEEIQNCEEPEKVGQYLAAKDEANQIQEIANNLGEDLSAADLASANEILKRRNFEDDKEFILDQNSTFVDNSNSLGLDSEESVSKKFRNQKK